MQVSCFDFSLPPHAIAQFPVHPRDHCKLLVYSRTTRIQAHKHFFELPYLLSNNDLLVINNSRVRPARLFATKPPSPNPVEILLLKELTKNHWWSLVRPGRRVRLGDSLPLLAPPHCPTALQARAIAKNAEGHCLFEFVGNEDIIEVLERLGQLALPPYIQRPNRTALPSDRFDYQTVYAQHAGSIAAPTAGLHFTPQLLTSLTHQGIEISPLTLHVGLGTFAPVKTDHLADHKMHSEPFVIPPECLNAIARTRARGGRVVAVGTTVLRALESAARSAPTAFSPPSAAAHGLTDQTDIFITPPSAFRVVDALITNFHLPKSTLLMLVSAFLSPGSIDGIDRLHALYREALQQDYRFFSYGDAMLIL